jgi:cob(I)alamin adenosyltransferase
MKIYTKTGDRGQTGLFGGARVSKADLRVATYGDVDELNSALGLAIAEADAGHDFARALQPMLQRIQGELFVIGAELASSPDKSVNVGITLLADSEIAVVEREIDGFDAELPKLTTFVLPGGTKLAAFLHLARTVCRRAERSAVALDAHQPLRPEIIRYLNRLSDWLFTAARYANFRAKVADVPWHPRG